MEWAQFSLWVQPPRKVALRGPTKLFDKALVVETRELRSLGRGRPSNFSESTVPAHDSFGPQFVMRDFTVRREIQVSKLLVPLFILGEIFFPIWLFVFAGRWPAIRAPSRLFRRLRPLRWSRSRPLVVFFLFLGRPSMTTNFWAEWTTGPVIVRRGGAGWKWGVPLSRSPLLLPVLFTLFILFVAIICQPFFTINQICLVGWLGRFGQMWRWLTAFVSWEKAHVSSSIRRVRGPPQSPSESSESLRTPCLRIKSQNRKSFSGFLDLKFLFWRVVWSEVREVAPAIALPQMSCCQRCETMSNMNNYKFFGSLILQRICLRRVLFL